VARIEVTIVALLAACGGSPPPLADEPVPATDRDPPTWVPTARSEGRTGEPAALAISGGAEQARSLLVQLVLAIRDGNESAIEASLAERVSHAQSGLARTTWTRGTLARQIVAAAAASHVEMDATFDSLIDPATIHVVDASAQFESGLPPSVSPTDVVILFTPTAEGRRLLAGLGSATLVIRPGPTPVVIAR